MSAAYSMLLAKISALADWFGRLFVGVFKSLWDLITDVFCWLLDGFLSIAVTAVSAIDVSGFPKGAWGQLPTEIVNVMAVLGVAECVSIITAAIVIRLGLQLIPFVRLGS